jgi:hypothetical protein
MARHARRVPAEATRALTSSRTKQVVRQTGGGVGLAVPGDSDRNAAKLLGDGASER